jgi:hypothetical protein
MLKICRMELCVYLEYTRGNLCVSPIFLGLLCVFYLYRSLESSTLDCAIPGGNPRKDRVCLVLGGAGKKSDVYEVYRQFLMSADHWYTPV